MPRAPLLAREMLPPDKQPLYDQIAAQRGHVAPPFAALLNSPEVAARVAALGERLRYSGFAIPAEVRETVTLAVARHMRCQYIFTHHVASAKQAGLREEVVQVIRDVAPPRRLLPKEGVFVQFTRELLEEKRVRDATYAAVEHLLGRQATIELIVTIGYYALQCYVVNALGIELEEGVQPLMPSLP
ncbi:MAG: carboxymuconolactone decarboxylase family protein [Chloroflexi bacterium]|nr:carboxymuconolactone decarboxylase family protein [Chloroflexota bacterium]